MSSLKTVICFLITLLSLVAYARSEDNCDDCLVGSKGDGFNLQVIPSWGFSRNILSTGTAQAERLWEIAFLKPVSQRAFYKAVGGVYLVRPNNEQRNSSAFGSISWGYRVFFQGAHFVEASIGPGFISDLDSSLGGHLQIFHDLAIGIMELGDGYGLALGFKHISSAGLFRPNRGRDFLQMKFMLGF